MPELVKTAVAEALKQLPLPGAQGYEASKLPTPQESGTENDAKRVQELKVIESKIIGKLYSFD